MEAGASPGSRSVAVLPMRANEASGTVTPNARLSGHHPPTACLSTAFAAGLETESLPTGG